MHMSEADVRSKSARAHWAQYTPATVSKLDFLWLELTNRCNLACVHCYTESDPHSGDRDLLTSENYKAIMRQAYDLGCRKLQFIGGEPQLNRDFYPLLVKAKEIGFTFIEVFTNLTRLDEKTVDFAAANNVCFATSVYSDRSDTHDLITKSRGSHARTVGNLQRLIGRGITTRAGVVIMDSNADQISETRTFLHDLGVGSIRASRMREFGRAEETLGKSPQLSSLCGHCWAGKLCVAPDGEVYPCVMARHWSVGNILEQSLAEIVNARSLAETRTAIYGAAWLPRMSAQNCAPANDGTYKERDPKEACEPDARVDETDDEETLPECPQTECVPPSCLMDCSPDCLQTCEPNPN